MEARLCSTVALRAALYPNAVRSAVHHQGTCGKHERSSQLPTSVSGKQCIGYFGAAEGQHTRITPVWNIVPHFKVGVKETPLPKVPLGTAVVRGCWHSRLYQALSMRCNGRRETIYPSLAAMDVLPAQLSCSCEAPSWSSSVLSWHHVARTASQGLADS